MKYYIVDAFAVVSVLEAHKSKDIRQSDTPLTGRDFNWLNRIAKPIKLPKKSFV